ncbi:MAG: MATE family efflux transporter [Nitrososphaerota archaeon]
MAEDSKTSLKSSGISKYREKIINGPIIRTLFWLGTPPLVNQLVIVAYNVTDSYWLSNYSEIVIAVPRQMWSILMLLQAIANALTIAILSLISQYVGSKAYKEASLSASRFFTLAFLSGGVLSIMLTDVIGKIISIIALAYILRENYSELKIGFTKNMGIMGKIGIAFSILFIIITSDNLTFISPGNKEKIEKRKREYYEKT